MQYPPLRATDLVPFQRIQSALQTTPGYLDAPECPYSPEIRDFLRGLGGVEGAAARADTVFLGSEGERFDVVAQQIDLIYSELNSLSVQDPGERIQIAKAKAQLIEKLVTLHERTLGLKHMSDFKKAVIAGVDTLGAAEREMFFKKLEAVAGDEA